MGPLFSKPQHSLPPPHRSTNRQYLRRQSPSLLSTLAGAAVRSVSTYALVQLTINFIQSDNPLTQRQRHLLEARLFDVFDSLLKGNWALAITRLMPLLALLENPNQVLNFLMRKARQEDSTVPSAPPAPFADQGVEIPDEFLNPQHVEYQQLLELGASPEFLTNLPVMLASDCIEAIINAISDNATDPITLDPLITPNRTLVSNVTAVFHPRQDGGFHVFLYDSQSLSDWLSQSSIDPLTRQTIRICYRLS
ncbi:hypothetical protein P9112_007065 [Eukaryota sp. TZLM1-RC]